MKVFPAYLMVGGYRVEVQYNPRPLQDSQQEVLFGRFFDTELRIEIGTYGIQPVQIMASLIHEYYHAVLFLQGHTVGNGGVNLPDEESAVRLMESATMVLLMDNPGLLGLIRAVRKDYEDYKRGRPCHWRGETERFGFPMSEDSNGNF